MMQKVMGLIIKKCLIGLVLAILLLPVLLGAPLLAADFTSLQLTYYQQENMMFILEGGMLTVANLPESEAFATVLVSIVNESGREQSEEVLTRSAGRGVSLSLGGLADGYYYIELFFYKGGGDYASYVYGKDIRFQWQNGVGAFVEPLTLPHNRMIFAARRSDNAAIAYSLTPTGSIQSADLAIVKKAQEITSGLTGDYEKAAAIHDWVCANLWYDNDAVSSEKKLAADAVSVLNRRRAVCDGYANLNAALLRAAGIPAKAVHGYGLGISGTGGWSEQLLSTAKANHSWNEAYIGGRWVLIDATWDCNNIYRGGRKVENGGLHSHRYFDATIEAFSLDHRMDEENIPPPDSPSSWAAAQVQDAISAGLAPPVLRWKYTQATTRAEFCALAAAVYETLAGQEIAGRLSFSDTADTNVEKMAALGVVNGVGGNKFAPDDQLSREQAAVMLARLAEAIGKPLPQQAATFADSGSISAWAIAQAGQVQAAGIMGGIGNNTFAPKAIYTREQSIITIWRLYVKLK